ncbi:hypothetical protein TWF106_008220 [Orbilia oligospora]|uniref:Rhodopsin domain-containing protein n=1 Tax=Orbilia oligospora TaxID=2813651 RepID=A0A7C8QL32_ORBOL|nr:hypothetical protein TWF679_006757 [Orbilia oligospora]KAF3216593.1 hypothetical protein TWF106_008220 [Orbilia oligospora]
MGGPPHPQTPEDRAALLPILLLFNKFPRDFEFPLEVDPQYVPPVNSFYCLVAGLVMCAFSTIVVCLRLWIRSRGVFGMDDWVMIAAFLSYCAFNVVNLVAVLGTGLGYHIYDLSLTDIHNYLIMQFLHVIFWFCALHLCRCSILHLFLRLAHLQSEGQKLYLRTVLGLSYAFLFACIIVQIFECGTPVSRTFDLEHKYDGTCIGSHSTAVYGGLIAGHIALDALTIFPPLFTLARLPLAPGKKFNLIFLLILGIFTMVFSAVRLFVFYQIMVDSYDLTWNATAVAFWGILESSLAAIITCLPALNQVMIRVLRRVYNHSTHGNSSTRSRKGTARSSRLGISIFERNHIYKGPAKFVSYSADATVSGGGTIVMPDYVELNSQIGEGRRSRGGTSTPGDVDPLDTTARRLRSLEQTRSRNESLTDITVERSFYVTEERASDLELREAQELESRNQSKVSLTKPSKVARFFDRRRPSSPTIPLAAREAAAAIAAANARKNSIVNN